MNKRLADISDKPPFVGDIVIESCDFSNNMPVVQPIKLLPPKAPYEIVCCKKKKYVKFDIYCC